MDYSLIVSSGLGLLATGLFFAAFRHFSRAERRLAPENRRAPDLVPEITMAANSQSAASQRRTPLL